MINARKGNGPDDETRTTGDAANKVFLDGVRNFLVACHRIDGFKLISVCKSLRAIGSLNMRLIVACYVSILIFQTNFQVQARQAKEPPNILLIIADDMGLDASPCYKVSKRKPKMPTLERMCREGIVFENAYAAPICSPTRATMMTGRYGFRTGVGTVARPGGGPGLKVSEKTIFQFLDQHTSKGYAHAVIGKWHLSDRKNGGVNHPQKTGVGHYAGVIRGRVPDYYSWPRTERGKTKTKNGYITSVLTNEAARWINRQRKPWFLWLAHVAPHSPFHLPPKNLHDQFELNGERPDIRARTRDYYFAALEALDSEIRRLLQSIPKSIRDNTVVIFIGDNGTPPRVAQAPYSRRRAKSSVFEGGTHVPMIVWGRGVLRRGAREKALINSTDIFATVAELAGVDLSKVKNKPEDSISFAKLLKKSQKTGRDFAYVEHFGPENFPAPERLRRLGVRGRMPQQYGWAIRDGRWKYIKARAIGEGFYDLSRDPHEKRNLISRRKALSPLAAKALRRLKAKAKRLRRK